MEHYVRCNSCQKAHKIMSKQADKDLSIKFLCKCGNTMDGTYTNLEWKINNATEIVGPLDEPAFIHEPELS